jgi:hypothetical protein
MACLKKTQFRKNHDEVIDAHIKGNHSPSIAPHLVGLTTCGSMDPTSGHEVKTSLLENGRGVYVSCRMQMILPHFF